MEKPTGKYIIELKPASQSSNGGGYSPLVFIHLTNGDYKQIERLFFPEESYTSPENAIKRAREIASLFIMHFNLRKEIDNG